MNIRILFNQIFSKYAVKPLVDPKVVQYVISVMNYKNAQLGNVFSYVTIVKLVEKFLNIPNAFVVKAPGRLSSLYLTSTTLDILEHLVLDEHAHTYTVTCIAPASPYTMKVVLTKKRAERMIWAMIEHELGHVYYPHHCRLYRPWVMFKGIIALASVWIGVYKKFGLSQNIFYELPFWGLQVDLLMTMQQVGLIYLVGWVIPQYINSSFTPSTHWEKEADEFISNDAEILKGMILFQEIALKAQIYIYAYSNWWICLHAWFKKLDPCEFTKKNRLQAHAYFEKSSSLGDAYHPLSENRIARFKERIAQLAVAPELSLPQEQVTITIYKETHIVEKFIY